MPCIFNVHRSAYRYEKRNEETERAVAKLLVTKLFKHFENIPITANGKTDYRTLKSAEKT